MNIGFITAFSLFILVGLIAPPLSAETKNCAKDLSDFRLALEKAATQEKKDALYQFCFKSADEDVDTLTFELQKAGINSQCLNKKCDYTIFNSDISSVIGIVKEQIKRRDIQSKKLKEMQDRENLRRMNLARNKSQQICTTESSAIILKNITLTKLNTHFMVTSEDAGDRSAALNQTKELEKKILSKLDQCDGEGGKSVLKAMLEDLKSGKYTYPTSCSITLEGADSNSEHEYVLKADAEWVLESNAEPVELFPSQRVFHFISKKFPGQKMNVHCVKNKNFPNFFEVNCYSSRKSKKRRNKSADEYVGDLDLATAKTELFNLGLRLDCIHPSEKFNESSDLKEKKGHK